MRFAVSARVAVVMRQSEGDGQDSVRTPGGVVPGSWMVSQAAGPLRNLRRSARVETNIDWLRAVIKIMEGGGVPRAKPTLRRAHKQPPPASSVTSSQRSD